VLGLLVAVVIILLVLPRGGGSGRPGGAKTPQLAFARSFTIVGLKTPADQAARLAPVDEITKMFTDFYQEAFVDPEKWGDGTFEDLKKLFAEEAQPAFTKELASLTIGQARTELKFVDPVPSSLKISVFFDSKAAPMYATAAVQFGGRGTLKQKGPVVLIKQQASFYMQRNGDDWMITSFDANQTQETPSSPSPSPSAS